MFVFGPWLLDSVAYMKHLLLATLLPAGKTWSMQSSKLSILSDSLLMPVPESLLIRLALGLCYSHSFHLENYVTEAFLYWLGTCACRKDITTSDILLAVSEVLLAQTASNIGLPYILDSFLKLHIVFIFHMDSGRLSMCCNTSSRSCTTALSACTCALYLHM